MSANNLISQLSDNSLSIGQRVDLFAQSAFTKSQCVGNNAIDWNGMVQHVYSNVPHYSVDVLALLIRRGLFSYDELILHVGKRMAPPKRDALAALLGRVKPKGPQPSLQWENVDKKDRFQLDDYIQQNPAGDKVSLAKQILQGLGTNFASLLKDYIRQDDNRKAIQGITQFINREWVAKEDVLQALRADKNLLSLHTVLGLCESDVFQFADMVNVGFSNPILRIMRGKEVKAVDIPILNPIQTRIRISHDYYFWGAKGSGKSCALGAIMSTIDSGVVPGCSMEIDYNCQGSKYLEQLKGVFKRGNAVGVLPPGTQVGQFAEMGFDLNWQGHKKSITCIDMAGGMLYVLASKNQNPDDASLLQLNNLMKNAPKKNACSHIFLLEYKPGDRKNQADELDNAVKQISDLGLWGKTQEIVVLVTKTDKMGVDESRLQSEVERYISQSFVGFKNSLQVTAQKHGIKNGEIKILPFQIGSVELKNYCIFDSEYAARFVKKVFLGQN